MRKLASIQIIKDLAPIPGADKIEVAKINGWEVVVKKDEFKIGDKVIYIEIDSQLLDTYHFEFLRSKKFRIKTIKLKGQVSQGIIFNTSIISEKFRNEIEGYDLTDILGVKNYKDDEEVKDVKEKEPKSWLKRNLYRYKFIRDFFNKKDIVPFPSWIKKTDEERIQNYQHFLSNIPQWSLDITEKLDGQSATYFVKRNKWFGWTFGVCSRNQWLIKEDNSNWWEIARKYDLKRKMIEEASKFDREFYIQGEICGPGIQKNKYELTEKEFYLYNVFYNDFSYYEDIQKFAGIINVKHVPFMKLPAFFSISDVVRLSKGFSLINPNTIREGVVLRKNTRYQKISAKVINPDFLLKNDE